MAKCLHCGKKGLFLKLNNTGKCVECERIERLMEEENTIKKNLERCDLQLLETKKEYDIKLKAQNDAFARIEEQLKQKNSELERCGLQLLEIKREYENINNSKDILYNDIKLKAQNDAFAQIEQQLKQKNSELENVQEEIRKLQNSIILSSNKLLKVRGWIKSCQYSLGRNTGTFSDDTITVVNGDNIDEIDEFLSATVKLKLNLMDIRELRKRYNLNNKLIKELLVQYQSRYTTKANVTIYRLMVIALEAELQNTLYNLKFSKLERSIKDIKTITAKYQKIASDGNQNIAPTIAKFIGEIEYLYIEAIKIEYEYYIQKERIKEEQKSIKEKIRQEAAEKKQLELERRKVEQEEEKYKNEMLMIESQIKDSSDSILLKQLQERLAKVQAQLSAVEQKKDEIIRLEHGQAGYIYVISNLGSFGDNIFKIGMTRRMVPQDRIDELGDASVPFSFDIHCLIFSENASHLESVLHKQLHNKRVNKINIRKEFFNTTIDELEELVYNLEPSAEFNRTMLAEQYYQSMAVNEIPDNVEIISDDDINDEDEENT
jgi:hypothetical protein